MILMRCQKFCLDSRIVSHNSILTLVTAYVLDTQPFNTDYESKHLVMSLISLQIRKVSGELTVPGDKSISHRALIIGSVAVGETRIYGLLEGEDVLNTMGAVRALGAKVIKNEDGSLSVFGRGIGGLVKPETDLDMGNSGTAARLLAGLLATHPFKTVIRGDQSLSGRPMGRIIEPLEKMGATFNASKGGCLPLTIMGADRPLPIEYRLPVPSAQVKSAILLGGLNAPGKTTVMEPRPTRDHSERMLAYFGAELEVADIPGGGRSITLTGQPELKGREIVVPSDISSAAFPLVAALLVEGSEVIIRGVGINPERTGLLDTLIEMGAEIKIEGFSEATGEPVADLRVSHGPLRGVEVPAQRAPSMIDEYPILAIAAACAEGTTVMRGLAELRLKESDRLGAISKGLAECGVELEEGEDWIAIHGTGSAPKGGAGVAVKMDHRIAMSFLVLGMVTAEPVYIDDASSIDTSFPGFVEMMNGIGAAIGEKE